MKNLILVLSVLFILTGCMEDDPKPAPTYTVDYTVYNYQGGSYTVEYLDEAGDGHALSMSADFTYSFTVEGTPPDLVLLVDNTSTTMLILEVVFNGSEFYAPVEYYKVVQAGETGFIERFN